MTSPVGGRRHEHRWVRRAAATAAGAAFRPQQLRAHLALRLGLAQAQRDAAHGAAYGAAHATLGGDHLLEAVARVDDRAVDTGSWVHRAFLHAGDRGMRQCRRAVHVAANERRRTPLSRDGRARAAAVLLDYQIYVLVCTARLLSRSSRGILPPAPDLIGHSFESTW